MVATDSNQITFLKVLFCELLGRVSDKLENKQVMLFCRLDREKKRRARHMIDSHVQSAKQWFETPNEAAQITSFV